LKQAFQLNARAAVCRRMVQPDSGRMTGYAEVNDRENEGYPDYFRIADNPGVGTANANDITQVGFSRCFPL